MMTALSAAVLSAAAALATIAAAPASAAVGDWGQGQRASARLVASGIDADGTLRAGVEIVLPAGSETYWRTPGDAGVAPVVDLAGSTNIGAVRVRYPVPTRLDDGYSVTNVYYDRVVFLIDAPVTDPAKPVDLKLSLDLGVCDKVCVPDAVTASLHVPADRSDPEARKILAAVEPLIPGRGRARRVRHRHGRAYRRQGLEAGGEGHRRLSPTPTRPSSSPKGRKGGSRPRLSYKGEEAGKAVYTFAFSRLGSPVPVAGAPLRFTIRSGARAIEQAIALP